VCSYDDLLVPGQLPFFFSNAKGPLEIMQRKIWVIDMAPGHGVVFHVVLFTAAFTSPMEFQDFPFDTQPLELTLRTGWEWDAATIVMDSVDIVDKTAPGWKVESITSRSGFQPRKYTTP
jgi:hypothetical protein